MSGGTHTLDDYTWLYQRLLPRGKVWPIDPVTTPVWWSLLTAMAQEPVRLDTALFGILKDFIPAADMGYGLLEEWEELLGINVPAGATDAQRVAAIRAKLNSALSPSYESLLELLNSLGIGTVTITLGLYPQFLAGYVVGKPLGSVQGLTTWVVTYPAPVKPVFEATVRAIAPINTTILFQTV